MITLLAERGYEAVHWSTIGEPWAADSEILDFAAANGWIVFTHDLDFGMLLAALRTNRPSVTPVRAQDVLPPAIGDLLVRAIQTAESNLEAGALVTVEPYRHRVRVLPIWGHRRELRATLLPRSVRSPKPTCGY